MVSVLLAAALFGQMKTTDLRLLCVSSREACRQYVSGVLDGVFLAARVAADPRHFCLTGAQGADEVTSRLGKALDQDLARFPADADLSAASFVAAFVDDSFPCP